MSGWISDLMKSLNKTLFYDCIDIPALGCGIIGKEKWEVVANLPGAD